MFQSPRPARGATAGDRNGGVDVIVSIHAPRAGRDGVWFRENARAEWFQSTRPARGATHHVAVLVQRGGVSIHAPRAGRDWR